MILYKKLFTILVTIFFIAIHSQSLSNNSYGGIYKQAIIKNKPPLNILFIVNHFPAPSQIFILNIITGLIDQGHNVSIFSFHKDNPSTSHPNIEKYKLLDRVIYRKFPDKMPECDIVFCQFGYLGKQIWEMKNLTKWLKTKKTVVCFRGSDTTAYIKKDANMYQKLFFKAHLLLPVCDYFRKKLIKLGCPGYKVRVHYSAIDCSQFFFLPRQKPENDIIQLVSVCRLVKKKGLNYAIEAFAKALKNNPNLHYTIVGDGPELSKLELLIQKLELEDKVTLAGWKGHDEIVSILDRSHIFVLPSIRTSDGNEEGIPNALKEAMAMGLIVVGTWHAGTPELVDNGVSGFLVAERDADQLAKTIEYIIEHGEIWESVGLAARKKVEGAFETKQSIKKLEKLFYRLLGIN